MKSPKAFRSNFHDILSHEFADASVDDGSHPDADLHLYMADHGSVVLSHEHKEVRVLLTAGNIERPERASPALTSRTPNLRPLPERTVHD